MSSKNLYSLLLIVVVAALSYFNNLSNDFLWDDEFLIEKNTYIRDIKKIPEILVTNTTAGFGGKDNFYRPTQILYYLFIYQLFGESKEAFHLANIFLHILNGLLLYFLILSLFKSQKLALITSLLWTVHPAHVEAITYVSGTADPMGGAFFLASILLFLKYLKNRKKRELLISSMIFILALASKEALVVGPALLMVLLFCQNQDRFNPKKYYVTLPFWVISLSYLFLRKTLLNFDNTFDLYKTSNVYTENILFRIYTYLATLPEYLKIIFFPKDLHMERAFSVYTEFLLTPVLMGVILFLISLSMSVYFFVKKNNPIFLWGWLWFFVSFIPMNGILIPVNSLILEHWLYLSSMGVFLVIAYLITLVSSERLMALKTGLIVISLMALTHLRNRDWRDPITFYSNILKYTAGTARVHNNIAMAYADNQELEKAKAHYLKAIENSDIYPQTHYNLARVYIQLFMYKEALDHIEQSLKLSPDFSYSIELKTQLTDFLKTSKKNSQ